MKIGDHLPKEQPVIWRRLRHPETSKSKPQPVDIFSTVEIKNQMSGREDIIYIYISYILKLSRYLISIKQYTWGFLSNLSSSCIVLQDVLHHGSTDPRIHHHHVMSSDGFHPPRRIPLQVHMVPRYQKSHSSHRKFRSHHDLHQSSWVSATWYV